MAAPSVQDVVVPDSEERHERASYCASAHDDSLVGSPARARCCEMATQVSC